MPTADGGRLRESSFWRAVVALFTLPFSVPLAALRLLFAEKPGCEPFTVAVPRRLFILRLAFDGFAGVRRAVLMARTDWREAAPPGVVRAITVRFCTLAGRGAPPAPTL